MGLDKIHATKKYKNHIRMLKEEQRVWTNLAKSSVFDAISSSDIHPPDSCLRLVPDGCKVLDVGCGYGRNAIFLRDKKGCNIVGVDFAPPLLKYAKNMGIKVVQADACYLPFRDASFDYLISLFVLQHLPSFSHVEKALKEFKRVSRVSMFNIRNYLPLPTNIKGIIDYVNPARRCAVREHRRNRRLKQGMVDNAYTYKEAYGLAKSIFKNVKVMAMDEGFAYRDRHGFKKIKTIVLREVNMPLRIARFSKYFLFICS
ncbi:MAG: class I SAM-dependent methyltransferase [Candidatus Nealsonbacteria bacterium]|nr:MAG: class I SAM-dependent methyltransferase [Candidatus Nealsonbacteria bacterium]